jgi:hypothetical protein
LKNCHQVLQESLEPRPPPAASWPWCQTVSVLGVEAAETASKLLLSLSPVLFLMILLDAMSAGIRSVLGDGVRRGVPEKWEK